MAKNKAPQLKSSKSKMPTGEMEAGGVTYNYRGQAGLKAKETVKANHKTNKLAC